MPRFFSAVLIVASALLSTMAAGADSRATEARRTVAAAPAPEAPAGVRRVRLGVDDDKTRIVFELTRDTAFRTTPGGDSASVVLDLPAAVWAAPPLPGEGRGLVRDIVAVPGKPGGSRVTIRAAARVTIKSAFKLPGDSSTPPRLVVDLARAPGGNGPARDAVPPAPPPTAMGYLKPPKSPAQPATPASLVQPAGPTPAAEPDSGRGRDKPALPPPPRELPLVALDPGHGGNDPGAISPTGVFEKDITLATARETKRKLEETGRYRVMLTRDGDYFLELRERVAKARDAGADLFISMHADTIEQRPSVSGLSIYTLSETASDREAETLAAKENRADAVAGLNLSTENKEVASILISLAQRDTTNQSNRLAESLLSRLGRETNLLPVKPHRRAGFAVLTAPDVPSVLIELGYLSNSRDLSHLATSTHRERLARGVCDGVDAYFKWLREARRT